MVADEDAKSLVAINLQLGQTSVLSMVVANNAKHMIAFHLQEDSLASVYIMEEVEYAYMMIAVKLQ